MADENQEVQQPVVETGADQPAAEVTLDSFLGTDDNSGSPVVSPPKEDKRDFKTWAEKEKQRADKLEAELKTLRQPPVVPEQNVTPESLANDPGVQYLRQMIREEMQSTVSPLTAQQQRIEQETIFAKYKDDAIFKTFGPEVASAYQSGYKSGNLDTDFQEAIKTVFWNHRDEYGRAEREIGMEQGYKAKNFKASGGIVGRATTPQGGDDFEKRYREGTLSNQEFAENQDRIADIDRADRAAGR